MGQSICVPAKKYIYMILAYMKSHAELESNSSAKALGNEIGLFIILRSMQNNKFSFEQGALNISQFRFSNRRWKSS